MLSREQNPVNYVAKVTSMLRKFSIQTKCSTYLQRLYFECNSNVLCGKMENSNETKCNHFVKRKKRYCKMIVKKGSRYCVEHLPSTSAEEDNDNLLRVVCPLDNKHTCYAHKLEKHLKVCNARSQPPVPHIIRGVNCGDVEAEPNGTFQNRRQLATVEPEAIVALVGKIRNIYGTYLKDKIIENIGKHPIVEAEIKKPEYGDKTKKHLIQASSILALLERNGLVQKDTCYIEFGAGKGQLSFWTSHAVSALANSSVLLVERAAHRHKMDNKLDKSEGRVHRVRADIADLVLYEVEAVANKQVVGLTKHLCGDATDLSLRCLQKFQENGGKVLGVIMAFCCHHRCQWTAYTGKEFFKKVGLNRDDFDVMCGMVSWAICGSGLSREMNKNGYLIDSNNRDKQIGMSREEKEEIGKYCKHILDYGRLQFLESNKFKCSLNFYVSADISPENVCIVAKM